MLVMLYNGVIDNYRLNALLGLNVLTMHSTFKLNVIVGRLSMLSYVCTVHRR